MRMKSLVLIAALAAVAVPVAAWAQRDPAYAAARPVVSTMNETSTEGRING